jgi:hypothetical protein
MRRLQRKPIEVALCVHLLLGCQVDNACRAEAEHGGVQSQPIIGGGPPEPGAWPNVAWLDMGCTAVFVHPRLLIFAAHCGESHTAAWLGADLELELDVQGRLPRPDTDRFSSLGLSECSTIAPERGKDLGYCRTTEPYDGPLAPLASADELSRALRVNDAVTLVGYGLTSPDGTRLGQRRAVEASVLGTTPYGELVVGSPDAGTCPGDSGGPALAMLEVSPGEFQWRVVGVLSAGGPEECGQGYYTTPADHIGWLMETEPSLVPCASEQDDTCLTGHVGEDGLLHDVGVAVPKEGTPNTPLPACE